MLSLRRALTTWFAVLAVLVTTLAPAVSQAVGGAGGATWAEVCTSTGVQHVLVEGEAGSGQPVPGAAHLLDHCPYCALHVDVFPVPPALPAAAPPVLQPLQPPRSLLSAAPACSVRSSAQPRAPPLPL